MLEKNIATQPDPRRDPLMAWATHKTDGGVVHVSMLSREQSGLRCQCICAGCGAPLEAVNVGRPPAHFLREGTHRMSFRHHRGTQQDGCLRTAARAAMLHLLLESDEIDLPAYRATGRHRGIGGDLYLAQASGEPVRGKIEELHWQDAHSAVITLRGGRSVLIQLRSEVRIGQSVDAVLTIDTDDPEIASWSREKILEQARLGGSWACWEQHWDRDRVQAEADMLARGHAVEALDELPDGVTDGDSDAEHDAFAGDDFISGLSSAQRGETILHRELKNILSSIECLRIGEQYFEASWQPPDGPALRKPIKMPPLDLILSEVRLEQHLGDIVPDVVCQAEEANQRVEKTTLLVEVAVTHKVDEIKRNKIVRRGTPCLELDATRLVSSGRLTRTQLRSLVQNSPDAFRWMYHPLARQLIQTAQIELRRDYLREQAQEKKRLAVIAKRESEALERQRRIAAERGRIRYLAPKQVLREYLELQLQHRVDYRIEASWDDDLQPIYAEAFQHLGEPSWGEERLQQLLMLLETARAALAHSQAHRKPDQNVGWGWDAALDVSRRPKMRPFTTVVLALLKEYKALFRNSEQQAEANALRANVLRSIDAGESTFVRDPRYDSAIRLLFPELERALSADGMGSPAYAESRKESRRKEERRILEARLKEERQIEAKNAELRRLALMKALEPAKGLTWSRGGGVPFERWTHYQEVRRKNSFGSAHLIKGAYEAREHGQTVLNFIAAHQPTEKRGVLEIIRILRSVFLLA